MAREIDLLAEIRDTQKAMMAVSLWESPVVSRDQMSEMIGLAPGTLENLARQGKIPAFQPPNVRRWMFCPADVAKWAKDGIRTVQASRLRAQPQVARILAKVRQRMAQ